MNKFLILLAIFFNWFFAEAQKNTIPFTLTAGNNISIQAVVNKQDTVDLMFHTAASDMTLREEVVATMKSLKFSASADSVKSWGGQANVSRISNNNQVDIGFLTKKNITIAENINSGPGTDGKFGLNFFEGKIVEIDFDKRVVIIHDKLPKSTKKYQRFKLVKDDDLLFLEAICTVDGSTKLPNKFLVHSGYAGAILLDDQFVADNNLSEKIRITGGQELKDSFGNVVKTKKGIMPVFAIGNIESKNVPVGFFEGAIGRQKMSIIGMDVLKRFNFVVDAKREFIYVRENTLTNEKYIAN